MSEMTRIIEKWELPKGSKPISSMRQTLNISIELEKARSLT